MLYCVNNKELESFSTGNEKLHLNDIWLEYVTKYGGNPYRIN